MVFKNKMEFLTVSLDYGYDQMTNDKMTTTKLPLVEWLKFFELNWNTGESDSETVLDK